MKPASVWLTLALAANAVSGPADAQAPLPEARTTPCLTADEINNRFTPLHLYSAYSRCLSEGRIGDAHFLVVLGQVYGRFDARRVADPTAHQADLALRMQATENVQPETAAALKSHMASFAADQDKRAELCRRIERIGPPDYHPDYMINHGMSAYLKREQGNGLVAGFDPRGAWDDISVRNLRCTPSASGALR